MTGQLFSRLFKKYKRKKQRLQQLQLSKPLIIHDTAVFTFHASIKIGAYCRIGHECYLSGEGGIEIGRGTILAPRVVILSSSHNYKPGNLLPYGIEDKKAPVLIGSGCWIGWGAMICPGVTIGDGAVIAMGAVVTSHVEAGKVVGGNPAKIINERAVETDIERMVQNEQFFLKEVLEKNLVREGRTTRLREFLID